MFVRIMLGIGLVLSTAVVLIGFGVLCLGVYKVIEM